ncbi:MAG: LON peptidase substrate-binding domain-containing protein, partial [Planctomycetota bacterium]
MSDDDPAPEQPAELLEDASQAKDGEQPAGEAAVEAWPEDVAVVVAVRGMVLFPGVVLPVVVGRQRSIEAIQAAIQAERPVGLLLQQDAEDELPDPEEL